MSQHEPAGGSVLGRPDLRLAAIVSPRMVLSRPQFLMAQRELKIAVDTGVVGADGHAFLENFLASATLVEQSEPATQTGELDDWPMPIGHSGILTVDWKPIDPESPIFSGYGGAGSEDDVGSWWSQWADYYAYKHAPPAVVHESVLDPEFKVRADAFKTFLELSRTERTRICTASWDEIAVLAQSNATLEFRRELQSALRTLEEDASGAERARQAAETLLKKMLAESRAVPADLDAEIVQNRVETFIGLLVGSVPLLGTLYTGALGKVKEDELQAKRARVQWLELPNRLEQLPPPDERSN